MYFSVPTNPPLAQLLAETQPYNFHYMSQAFLETVIFPFYPLIDPVHLSGYLPERVW